MQTGKCLPSSAKDAGLNDDRRILSRTWLLRNSLMDSSSDSVGDILSGQLCGPSIREGLSPATVGQTSEEANSNLSINLTRI